MAGFSRAGLRDIKQIAQRNRLGRASHLAILSCQEREASWASKLPESKCVLFYFSQNTLVDNSGVANRDGENSPRRYGSLRGFLHPERGLKFAASTTRENDRPGRASESGLDIPAHLQEIRSDFANALMVV